jgi:hypothetical protein
MSLSANGNYSVYIPTIKSSYKSQDIGLLFWNNKIGDVTRVDFAQFKDAEKNEFRQAFVHFIPLERTNSVLEAIEQDGKYKFHPLNQYSLNEYWLFLKNNAPVEETEQNIHQIAHNAKLMEEKTAQMEEKMAQMMKKMDIVMELNVTLTGIVELQNNNIEKMSLAEPIYVKYPIYVKEEPKLAEEIYVKPEEIYVKEEQKVDEEQILAQQIVDLNNEINSKHFKHYENSPLGLINPKQSPNENTIHHLHSDGVITYQKGGDAYGQRSEFVCTERLNGHQKLNFKFVKEAEYTSYVILTNKQCSYYRGIMAELIYTIS